MKLAIAGAGMIAQEVLPILKNLDIEIDAIWSRPQSVEKLNSLSEKYDIKNVCTNYDALLENTDADTVYVATPNLTHYLFAKKALEAKKNVICEKPFTTDHEHAEELFEIAEKNNVLLFEAITNQYQPLYKEIRSKVENNELGDIKIINLNYSQYSSRYDRFCFGDIAPAFDITKGGGALGDLNVYNIYFAVGIFGSPKEVKYFPNIDKDVDTSGVLVMSYDNFKCVCIGSKDCDAEFHGAIQGTKASLSIDSPGSSCLRYEVRDNKTKESVSSETDTNHRMFAEFKHFKEFIDNKDKEAMNIGKNKTLEVVRILCEARKDGDIVFPDESNTDLGYRNSH